MIYRPQTLLTYLLYDYLLFENKQLYFKNVYDWLKPGGKLVIHLVNKELFDPILQAAIHYYWFHHKNMRKENYKFNC